MEENREIGIDEGLEITIGILEGINVPMSLARQIAMPMSNAIENLRQIVTAIRQQQAEKQMSFEQVGPDEIQEGAKVIPIAEGDADGQQDS